MKKIIAYLVLALILLGHITLVAQNKLPPEVHIKEGIEGQILTTTGGVATFGTNTPDWANVQNKPTGFGIFASGGNGAGDLNMLNIHSINNLKDVSISSNTYINGSMRLNSIADYSGTDAPDYFVVLKTESTGKWSNKIVPANFKLSWFNNDLNLFNGTWGALTGKPTVFNSNWASVASKPTINFTGGNVTGSLNLNTGVLTATAPEGGGFMTYQKIDITVTGSSVTVTEAIPTDKTKVRVLRNGVEVTNYTLSNTNKTLTFPIQFYQPEVIEIYK